MKAASMVSSWLSGINKAKWLPRLFNVRRTLAGMHGLRILDVGCGEGDLLLSLASCTTQCRLTGIDIDSVRVKTARRNAAKLGVASTHFLQASAINLPFDNGSFDIAISSDVLQEIQEDSAAIQELRRVISPSGTICLTLPAKPVHEGALFASQRALRAVVPACLHNRRTFSGKNWLLAARDDVQREMLIWRYYDHGRIAQALDRYFRITHQEYFLRQCSAVVTDLCYGVRGFSILLPVLLSVAVRIDRLLPDRGYGTLLAMELK